MNWTLPITEFKHVISIVNLIKELGFKDYVLHELCFKRSLLFIPFIKFSGHSNLPDVLKFLQGGHFILKNSYEAHSC